MRKTKEMPLNKTDKTFATFCKKHRIADNSIRWHITGDQRVKISISKPEFEAGGWNLISVGLMFALRELGVSLDVTVRDTSKDIDIVVEK